MNQEPHVGRSLAYGDATKFNGHSQPQQQFGRPLRAGHEPVLVISRSIRSDHNQNQIEANSQRPAQTKLLPSVGLFQRKLKTMITNDSRSLFKVDPTVNRPQVLASGNLESLGIQRMKERTDCAVQWANPYTGDSQGQTQVADATTNPATSGLISEAVFVQTPPYSAGTGQPRPRRNSDATSVSEARPRSRSISDARRGKSTESRRLSLSGFSVAPPVKPVEAGPAGKAPAVTVTTPMGSLLMTNKENRTMEGEAEQPAKPAFGVNDFVEMYRMRAYSDASRHSRRAFVAKPKQNKRRNSMCDSPIQGLPSSVSGGGDGDNGRRDDDLLSPPGSYLNLNRRRTSLSVQKLVPDTIPENTELTVCASFTSLPTPLYATEDTDSVGSCGGSQQPLPVDDGLENGGRRADRMSMNRRFSEPLIQDSHELSNLRSMHLRTRLHRRHPSSESMSSCHSNDSYSSFKSASCLPISPDRLGIDPPPLARHHVILWRAQRSTQILKLPAAVEFHDAMREVIASNENLLYAELMKFHRCFDLMPKDSTVILLDIHLTVVNAFYAMTQQGVKAATLWDPDACQFVGMLTVTDFIRSLQRYRHSAEELERLKDETILSWKEKLGIERHLAHVEVDDNLYEAVNSLSGSGFHRLPVLDSINSNILFTLDYKRILQFICLFLESLPLPTFMSQTIWELKVGTFESLAYIGVDCPLFEAFDLLLDRRVSALPVVNDKKEVINVFSRADSMVLAANESFKNLTSSVQQVLTSERESFEGVYTCKRTDSLGQIVDWIVRANVHRLIVVDADRKLDGIVSVSDVVRFMVLQHSESVAAQEDADDAVFYIE